MISDEVQEIGFQYTLFLIRIYLAPKGQSISMVVYINQHIILYSL